MSRPPDLLMARRKIECGLRLCHVIWSSPPQGPDSLCGWCISRDCYTVTLARLLLGRRRVLVPTRALLASRKGLAYFWVFLLTGYLSLFVTKNESSFTLGRVPEAAICKSFRARKRNAKKTRMVWSRRSNCSSSSTKPAVASSSTSPSLCLAYSLTLHIATFNSLLLLILSLLDTDLSQRLLYRSSFLLLYPIVLQHYSVSSIFRVFQFPVIKNDARFGLAGSGAYYHH